MRLPLGTEFFYKNNKYIKVDALEYIKPNSTERHMFMCPWMVEVLVDDNINLDDWGQM